MWNSPEQVSKHKVTWQYYNFTTLLLSLCNSIPLSWGKKLVDITGGWLKFFHGLFFFPSYYLWFQFRFLLHLGIFLTPRHVRNNIPLAFLFIATQEKLRATVIAIDAIFFNIVEWFNVFFCFSFVFSWNLHGNFFCWVSLVLISGHVSWLEISNHRKLYTKLYYAVIKNIIDSFKNKWRSIWTM